MGKCSKCGKNIEYNDYRVISGLVYCPNCTPEEAVDPEVMKAEAEAQEQFEKDMAKVDTSDCDPEEKKITETLVKTVKDSKVELGELAEALGTVASKKKRVKK